MATFYILVMNKNEDQEYWNLSSQRASSINELETLICYDDSICEVLPKLSYHDTKQVDVKIPRCADMTIKDDGRIYELQGD